MAPLNREISAILHGGGTLFDADYSSPLAPVSYISGPLYRHISSAVAGGLFPPSDNRKDG